MKKLAFVFGMILILVIILSLVGVGIYNSFVTKSQAIDAQWAQVETQYQRRFDLIPNLVNSVKGIMAQEQTVFLQIAEARTRYAGSITPAERTEAANEVESALARLLVIMENYPQLRSIEAVVNLMDELAGTENRIAVERGRYNTAVRDYNIMVKTIPTNLIASLFGFSQRQYFESYEGADLVPSVDFG